MHLHFFTGKSLNVRTLENTEVPRLRSVQCYPPIRLISSGFLKKPYRQRLFSNSLDAFVVELLSLVVLRCHPCVYRV